MSLFLLDANFWDKAAPLGEGASVAIILFATFLYFQIRANKQEEPSNMAVINLKLSELAESVAEIRTELVGMNGSGGGLKGDIASLMKWRNHDLRNEIQSAIAPLDIRITRLEDKV